MSVEVIIAIIGLCAAPISSFATWVVTKKKEDAEADSTIIESMKLSLEFYKLLSDDNRSRLEEVIKRNEELDKRNAALELELTELRKQVFSLMNSLCLNLSCQLRVRDNSISKPETKTKTISKKQA